MDKDCKSLKTSIVWRPRESETGKLKCILKLSYISTNATRVNLSYIRFLTFFVVRIQTVILRVVAPLFF